MRCGISPVCTASSVNWRVAHTHTHTRLRNGPRASQRPPNRPQSLRNGAQRPTARAWPSPALRQPTAVTGTHQRAMASQTGGDGSGGGTGGGGAGGERPRSRSGTPGRHLYLRAEHALQLSCTLPGSVWQGLTQRSMQEALWPSSAVGWPRLLAHGSTCAASLACLRSCASALRQPSAATCSRSLASARTPVPSSTL